MCLRFLHSSHHCTSLSHTFFTPDTLTLSHCFHTALTPLHQVCVFGTKGDTGLQTLANSRNNFERNKLDVFFFTAPDIGNMTSCRVSCVLLVLSLSLNASK